MLYIGIDLGATSAKVGVVDESGRILCKSSCKTGIERGFEPIAADMAETCRRVVRESGHTLEEIVAVGVGIPGEQNRKTGLVAFCNNLGWVNVPLMERLQTALGIPVYVDNDANVAALAESAFGASKDVATSILVTLGTGIGGGIIENGRLIQGRRGIGGEIGHYIINFDGVECPCGNRGCFERYGSTGALVRRFTENVALLEKLGVPAEDVNGKVIFDHLDDADVSATVNSWIDSIAFGIIGLVHIFNPEMVLIGGGISREDEHFIRPLREKILNGAMEQFAKDLEVEAAALGNNAGLLGACAYFRQNF